MLPMIRKMLILIAIYAYSNTLLYAAQFKIVPVDTTISIPWGITQLPDNSLLVTDRKGTLHLIKENGKSYVVNGVPKVIAQRQGGLLDVVLHPDYERNGWIYFSYSTGRDGRFNTAISRAKLAGKQSNYYLTDLEVIYKAQPYKSGSVHFGSRIAFDKDKFLYFSIGDRGMRDVNPQDITRDAGKIYRLHDDGRIPKDNPFTAQGDAKKAIYSFGHRNPQGLALNPNTSVMWSHEHGPKGGDELNIIHKGKNYGWPVISYGVNYNGSSFTEITKQKGMEQPINYWVPSIAPSGMSFITSDKYPSLKGHLLIGSLKFAKLIVVNLAGNKVTGQQDVLKSVGRVRSIFQGRDGNIYLGIDGRGVYRLAPQAK